MKGWLASFALLFQVVCGYNVTYDERALIIDGERRLLVAGCVHYPRSTPEMWPHILAETKAAGIDLIQTYVFWNIHEPQPGQFYFEEEADLLRFLRECQKLDLYVNLRIGPYVCAEWNYGGYPAWLREVEGIVFRTYNEPYLRESERWVRYITKMVQDAGMFAPEGGPIILAQIENEYGNVQAVYDAADVQKYIQWNADLALSLEVNVPWIMCVQEDAPPQVINTCNGYYCNGWTPNRSGVPTMWTENWPGWFVKWGDATRHRPVEDVAFAVARFFASGGVFMCYYMWHGGTNFGRWAGDSLITSYDYDAGLDEFGHRQEPKYSHSADLHAVLNRYNDVIVNSPKAKAQPLGKFLEAHSYAYNGDRVTFLSNIGVVSADLAFEGQNFTVPAWSVSIIDRNGKVLYNTATISSSRLDRSLSLLASQDTRSGITIGRSDLLRDSSAKRSFGPPLPLGAWRTANDSIPAAKVNVIRANHPIMQLDLTHDMTDDLWYSVEVKANGPSTLRFAELRDYALLFLDGKYQGFVKGGLLVSFSLDFPKEKRTYTLDILVQAVGLVNFAPYMEGVKKGIIGAVVLGTDLLTDGREWEHRVGTYGEAARFFEGRRTPNASWTPAGPGAVGQPLTWFSVDFETPSGSTPLVLDATGLNKGMAWVNGRSIGRVFPAAGASGSCNRCSYIGAYMADNCMDGCGGPAQLYYHIPREWLKDGQTNELVILEYIGGNPEQVAIREREAGMVCAAARENQVVQLECSEGQTITEVIFASYGKPNGQCRMYEASDCDAGSVPTQVRRACVGERGCAFTASNDFFGEDPCPGEHKSLAIQVVCA